MDCLIKKKVRDLISNHKKMSHDGTPISKISFQTQYQTLDKSQVCPYDSVSQLVLATIIWLLILNSILCIFDVKDLNVTVVVV